MSYILVCGAPCKARNFNVEYKQGVYKRMMRFQKFIKRLHSATGRCPPPPIFTGNYESYTIMFSKSAGSDVLQMGTTTYTYYRVDVCRVTQGAHIEGL
jgi:hypothetical protein